MATQHVPAPNKKLENFTNEELQQELAIRHAILAAWTGTPTSTRRVSVPAAPPGMEQGSSSPPTSKRRRAKRKSAAKKGSARTTVAKQSSPAPETPASDAAAPKGKKGPGLAKGPRKKRARRGISPSGKTTAQFAIEALANSGGARTPAFLVPLMTKAGWETSSPDPATVVTTTLKKAAAQKKVKKVDGKNEFRAS